MSTMPKWDVWLLMDLVTGIIELESGNMDEKTLVKFVKEHMTELWKLQGSYQRMIYSMKKEGLI